MRYSDLQIGMNFNIKSEDYPHEETKGKIIALGLTQNKSVFVQFDDTLDTYTQGREAEHLPKCLHYLGA